MISKSRRVSVLMTAIAVTLGWHSAGAQMKVEKPTQPLTVTRMDTGPAPAGVTVTGSPAAARVSWQAVPGAVSYKVVRTRADDPSCCVSESPSLTSTSWTDTGPNGQGLQWSGSYVFTVNAFQSNGIYGKSSATWARPEPANPAHFRSKVQPNDGSIVLEWDSVPGADYYWLWGPGVGVSEGKRMNGTSTVLANVPPGAAEWKITTKYDPAGFLLPESSWPRVTMNVEKWSDYYRIVLNGAVVNSPTTDNALNTDGWGDEVKFGGMTAVFDRWKSAPSRVGVTLVPSGGGVTYGDVNGYAQRIRAGSAGKTGGLRAGDVVPPDVDVTTPYGAPSAVQLPLLLWEGKLTNAHEVVLVTPTVYEIDEDNRSAASVAPYPSSNCPPDHVYQMSSIQAQVSSPEILPSVVEPIREPSACERWTEFTYGSYGLAGDRPIGQLPGKNDPTRFVNTGYYLVLTREKIERALAGRSYATVKVDRVDQIEGQNGNYSLYILIQRM